MIVAAKTTPSNRVTRVLHGLKGKLSNSGKQWQKEQQIFESFVLQNRLPNHRKKGKIKYFLLPKWTSLRGAPKAKTPEEHCFAHSFNEVLSSLYTDGNNTINF
jgi:hypothetical protein